MAKQIKQVIEKSDYTDKALTAVAWALISVSVLCFLVSAYGPTCKIIYNFLFPSDK